jgi:beta-N-acetylhexosaminidase
VDRTLVALSLRDRVAQLVTVWVLGDYSNVADSNYARPRQWIEQDHVGGVIMSLGSPLEVAAKVNSMQRLALGSGPRIPLLVSSDLEPGLGRFEGGVFAPQLWSAGSATVLPTNMAAGATGRPEDADAIGRIVGREARAAGIHVDFAPDVDVNNNPGNPVINVRSFGEDPQAVARYSAAFVRGLQAEGVAGVAKHFPGHGDTDADSHLALPVVRADRARLDALELVPFRAALGAGVVGVMSAHIALPALEAAGVPATLSPLVMTGLLRDSLGFRGITFTDAMTMEGVGKGYPIERSCPLAVQAGMDVLLMPTDVARCVDAVLAGVAGGQIAQARIDASVRRVLELKVRTGAVSRPIVDLEALRETVGAPAHWNTARDVARRAVTLLRDSANLVPAGAGRTITAVVYAPDAEVSAGQPFVAELRAGGRQVREFRVSPRTSAGALDSIAQAAQGSDRLVVMTYTRTFEGAGRLAIPAHVARWIDAQARAASWSWSPAATRTSSASSRACRATWSRTGAATRSSGRPRAPSSVPRRSPDARPSRSRASSPSGDGIQRGRRPAPPPGPAGEAPALPPPCARGVRVAAARRRVRPPRRRAAALDGNPAPTRRRRRGPARRRGHPRRRARRRARGARPGRRRQRLPGRVRGRRGRRRRLRRARRRPHRLGRRRAAPRRAHALGPRLAHQGRGHHVGRAAARRPSGRVRSTRRCSATSPTGRGRTRAARPCGTCSPTAPASPPGAPCTRRRRAPSRRSRWCSRRGSTRCPARGTCTAT